MAETSAYMARIYQFIQKTDAFIDRTKMQMQNQEVALKSLENQVGKHGKDTVVKPNTAEVLDDPAPADTPASAGEDQNIPPKSEENNTIPTAAPHIKLPITDTFKEIRPPPPFPQRLKKQKQEYQFKKLFHILKQVHINMPLVETLQQMPNYAKFLKDMVTRKTKIEDFETAGATEAYLAMMHNKVLAKRTDPGSFTIPCSIGNNYSCKALCDPGASINLMPKSVFQKLGIRKAKLTIVMLQLADRSYVQP
ncbi:hypothetical protein V6N13_025002 [Hibiscus sabdariffa]